MENRKVKQVLSGAGEDISKGCRRVNIVEKLCTYV
jgi:hypothetical protein